MVPEIPLKLLKVIKEFAEQLKKLNEPVIVSHIDADGITSASIIYDFFARLGKEPEVIFLKQLNEEAMDRLPWGEELIFLDLGSSFPEELEGYFLIDHHEPIAEKPFHLNAHFLGLNGSTDISTAGLCYAVEWSVFGHTPKAISAVVGMVGDRIDTHGLKGLAALPLQSGYVERAKGLLYFGRETRPLYEFLSRALDPELPGISGNEEAAKEFLEALGLPLEVPYNHLDRKDKTVLNDAVIAYAASYGIPVHLLFGEYYLFPGLPERTEMRDATEFSTLLNACGRHEKPELGLQLLLGKNVYWKARRLLRKHRMLIGRGLEEVEVKGTESYRNFELFFADNIKSTIVGIVAGMAQMLGKTPKNKPIIAVAREGKLLKISARASKLLVLKGLNLGRAMREAARGIGEGGGHDIAAGAYIPEGHLSEFLERLDRIIEKQLRGGE